MSEWFKRGMDQLETCNILLDSMSAVVCRLGIGATTEYVAHRRAVSIVTEIV